jgi:hypothetical protein
MAGQLLHPTYLPFTSEMLLEHFAAVTGKAPDTPLTRPNPSGKPEYAYKLRKSGQVDVVEAQTTQLGDTLRTTRSGRERRWPRPTRSTRSSPVVAPRTSCVGGRAVGYSPES